MIIYHVKIFTFKIMLSRQGHIHTLFLHRGTIKFIAKRAVYIISI